jgi:hypothetical protein
MLFSFTSRKFLQNICKHIQKYSCFLDSSCLQPKDFRVLFYLLSCTLWFLIYLFNEHILSKLCAKNDIIYSFYSICSMCLHWTYIEQNLSGSRRWPNTCNIDLNFPRQNICIANCKQSQLLHLVWSKFDHWTNTSKIAVAAGKTNLF